MTSPSVELEHRGPNAFVWLNRPDVRNAFDDKLIEALHQAFGILSQEQNVRTIVLAARGPAFCAGADLNWMARMANFSEAENRADAQRLADLLHAIHTFPKPVIARVQGDCYAGGIGLVAACDIALAVPQARFSLSEVKLGLIPATIAPYVVRAIGERAARRLMLTAERFDATEAQRTGLIHQLIAPEQLDTALDELLATLARNGPAALAHTKRLLDDVASQPLDARLRAETAERIARLRASPEGREGIQAFLQKRSPNWITDV